MSFGHKTDVQNHLSTKHPTSLRKLISETPDVVIEPVQNPEPIVVNVPATPVKESTVGSF